MSAETEVPDLYRLAFIPGCFRCPKCDFALSKQTLSVATGNIGTTEENRLSEPCPNDGTMMVHVTYRERLADYEKRVFEEIDLRIEADKCIEQLALALGRLKPHVWDEAAMKNPETAFEMAILAVYAACDSPAISRVIKESSERDASEARNI